MHLATSELHQYTAEFETEFTAFFKELITFSQNKLHAL